MPLDEYRAKRVFARSPEPKRETRRRTSRRGPRRFCVQKHLATQLHYDLRLEHDGVLLSWAVPKGPSLDPTVKRFAVRVEDHPLEYGDFEGLLPDGYGAGLVMLWDNGTWEPQVDDVEAALAKGDLKLKLEGYKLKGSWALVRTRGRGRGKPPADEGGKTLVAAHQTPRRLVGSPRHHRVRAAERQERRRLRRHPGRRPPRRLDQQPAGTEPAPIISAADARADNRREAAGYGASAGEPVTPTI